MAIDGVDAIPPTAHEWCQANVEPAAAEADYVSVTALCAALALTVRVAYVDGAPLGDRGGHGVTWHEFDGPTLRASQPGDAPLSATNEEEILLLYRPGHYDLLHR